MGEKYGDRGMIHQRAIELFDAGNYQDATPLLEQLCAGPGAEPELQARLAYILMRQGDYGRAESLLRSATTAQAGDAQLNYWLAVSVAGQGRLEEAKSLYAAVLAIAPGMPEAHNDLGHILRQLGDPQVAEEHFRAAVANQPRLVGALYNLGLSCAQRNAYPEAEQWYRQALEVEPGHFEALNNLGNILRESRRMEEAATCYRRAVQVRPEVAFAHANLAHTLENLHRLDEAEVAANAALELEPFNPVATLVVAQVGRRKGRLDAARARLEPLAFTGLPANQGAAVNGELGLVLDRLGEHQAAYEAWDRGNRAWLDALGAERSQDRSYLHYVADVTDYFSRRQGRDWPEQLPGSAAEAPIFLTGFPRSGTTLMEQILVAHSSYYTSREMPVLEKLNATLTAMSPDRQTFPRALDQLDDAAAVTLRTRYAEIVDTVLPRSAGATSLVDKLPLNLVELGLVRRVFPDSPVIVMLRDPRDVCLSAFAQVFQPNRAMLHLLSLEGAAELYSQVMDLWLHYRDTLGLRYREVRYEDLVDDLEATARGVFDFLGSDWEAGVLDFHRAAQGDYARTPSYQDITLPVYTRSVGRWRHYRDQLEPVLPMLEKYVTAFGYEPD
jgi:tetratricopeptide (TPR) repeat protein